ncbi:MAG: sensor histidine kinase [Elusimicrobiota bacterium]
MTDIGRTRSENRSLEERLRRKAFELRERTKELRCVYGISRICEKAGVPPESMLQQVVELIPASWQYPYIACARLVVNGCEFRSRRYRASSQSQRSAITVNGRKAGWVEVGYLRKRPLMEEGPFLLAERRLLDVVAERLGKILELKRVEAELRHSQQRLRDLLKSLENAREDERRRIAHEIHDELGHALMGMKMDVGSLGDKCPGKAACTERVEALASLIQATIRNVQRLASELKPVLLDDFGLPAAVMSLADGFQRRYGIGCRVRVPSGETGVRGNLAIVLYRSVQELLTNVARHAKAKKVVIELCKGRERLTLRVRDDGKGFDASALAKRKSLGLLGIRERVQGCGGEVSVEGAPGRGTSITISLPLRKRAGER